MINFTPMIANDLVYDIGMHDGADTRYYLHKGYRVLAIDANPSFIGRAGEEFKEHINNGKLTLLNIAIADSEGPVTFSISNDSHFSSVNKTMAARGGIAEEITVAAKKLSTVFEEYGIPQYCKIDIEGYDAFALRTIDKNKELPQYISAEAVAEPTDQKIAENEKLEILDLLHGLGYNKFNLVDQHTLTPLRADKKFYTLRMTLPARGFRHIKRKFGIDEQLRYRKYLEQKHNYHFINGASGPFGEEVNSEWYDYATARQMLLRHMNDHYSRKGVRPASFWCDWHAKLG